MPAKFRCGENSLSPLDAELGRGSALENERIEACTTRLRSRMKTQKAIAREKTMLIPLMRLRRVGDSTTQKGFCARGDGTKIGRTKLILPVTPAFNMSLGTTIANIRRRQSIPKEFIMKYVLCAALSLLLLGCGGGSPLSLTQENLDKVHDDMSSADVRSILGAPTESKDEPIPIVGGTQTTYTYRNDKSEVVIVFKNDQVKEKHGTFNP